MTPAERRGLDADSLWTDEGQVLWFLERGDTSDELTSVSVIAAELGCQSQVVVFALRKLVERGVVASRSVAGRKLWGTAGQIRRLDATPQQVAAEDADRIERTLKRHRHPNRDLEAVRLQLAMSVAGRGIEVSSLFRLYPSLSSDAQVDQMILVIGDSEAAAWLLAKLSEPGCVGSSSGGLAL